MASNNRGSVPFSARVSIEMPCGSTEVVTLYPILTGTLVNLKAAGSAGAKPHPADEDQWPERVMQLSLLRIEVEEAEGRFFLRTPVEILAVWDA